MHMLRMLDTLCRCSRDSTEESTLLLMVFKLLWIEYNELSLILLKPARPGRDDVGSFHDRKRDRERENRKEKNDIRAVMKECSNSYGLIKSASKADRSVSFIHSSLH